LQQTITQRVQLQQLVKLQQQQQQQQPQVKQPTIIVATTMGTTLPNINVSQLSGTLAQGVHAILGLFPFSLLYAVF